MQRRADVCEEEGTERGSVLYIDGWSSGSRKRWTHIQIGTDEYFCISLPVVFRLFIFH